MADQGESMLSGNERPVELAKRERLIGYAVALVLITAAFLVSYVPRWAVTVKRDGQGQTTETTTSSPSDSALAIALYSTGIALLFFTLNGLRLTKFSFGDFSGESAEISHALERSKEPMETLQATIAGDVRSITDDDVTRAFSRISQYWPEDIDLSSMASEIRAYLLYNGIAIPQQLVELVSSTEILNTLRSLYIRVLRRPRDKPLDPIAVAAWGPILYRLGVTHDVIRAIEAQLRASPEYHDRETNRNAPP